MGLGLFAYTFFGHVRHRIDQFMNEGTGYQTGLALKAFQHGGLLGVGPGAGTVKYRLPEAHSDFIFAVAGEEFGLIVCLMIIAVFGFIVLRGLLRLLKEEDLFVVLSCTGLVTGFGWTTMTSDDLEADDLLGSLATAESEAGGRALIMTGDRDMYQCASDSVDKLTAVLSDAQVDLNPHQIEAALLPDHEQLFSVGAGRWIAEHERSQGQLSRFRVSLSK